MAGTVRINIIGDAKGVRGATQEAEGALGAFGSKVAGIAGGIAASLGAAFGVAQLKNFADDTLRAATDMQESVSKIGVVFGDSAGEIEAWASTAATAMGMSKQQALEAAGTYGNLFQAFGVNADASADMSTNLVQLASDLASFNNANPEDVLLALRSGLSGETEPLKRFGIALSDTRLKAEAMAMGLEVGTGALDPATKAQAAYALIMKDSALAQGDFARTSDGLANSQRTLKASFEDLKANLGAPLIGPATEAVKALTDSMPVLQEVIGDVWRNGLAPLITAVGGALNELLPAFGPLINAFGTLVGGLAPVIEGLAVAFAPVLEVVGVLAQALAGPLAVAGNVIGGVLQSLSGPLTTLAELMTNSLRDAMPAINEAFLALGVALQGGMSEALTGIGEAFVEIWTAVAPLIPLFADLGAQLITELTPILPILGKAIADIATAFAGGLSEALSGLLEAVKPLLPVIGELAGILADGLADVLVMLAPVLADVAKMLGDGLARVMQELGPVMPSIARSLGKVADALGELLVALMPIIEPLLELVVLIVDELGGPAIEGIALALGAVAEVLAILVGKVADVLAAGIGKLTEWLTSLGDLNPEKLKAFFTDLPGNVAAWLGDVTPVLLEKGKELLGGLLRGIIEKGPDVLFELATLPPRAALAFGDLALTLLPKGIELLGGLASGIIEKSLDVMAWFAGLPGQVLEWVGDLARVLFSAGVNLIAGFLNGIKDKVGEVKDYLGSVTDWLPDWKGPADRDATILRPAGRLLMEGLTAGIAEAVPGVRAALAGVTSTIAVTGVAAARAASPARPMFTDRRTADVVINLDGREIARAAMPHLAAG